MLRVYSDVRSCPLLGRPASPFIGEGEGAGYREKRRKAREKKAVGVSSKHQLVNLYY